MTSKLTRERLEKIRSWPETYGAGSNVMLPAEEAEELARMMLAGMDSEPVAYAWVSRSGKKHLTRCEPEQWRDAVIVTPLYRHAQQPVVGYVPLGDSPYDIPYSMPSNLREFIDQEIGILFSDDDAQGMWIACRRAAMLNGGKS